MHVGNKIHSVAMKLTLQLASITHPKNHHQENENVAELPLHLHILAPADQVVSP